MLDKYRITHLLQNSDKSININWGVCTTHFHIESTRKLFLIVAAHRCIQTKYV